MAGVVDEGPTLERIEDRTSVQEDRREDLTARRRRG